ncbi:MAG TPA: hypothetical protein VFT43_14920, partial [Candidatus Polarisedimenticolia bacterium]|nr:hypothetical protein [Candidatus Polarisedimenticolia bacterium]
ADYQQTLADYAAWRAQQANAAVQAKLDRAMDETGRLADRVTSDPDYLSGFAAGVGAMRSVDLSRCEDLMGRDFDSLQRQPPQVPASTGDRQQRYAQGFQDGQRLLFGLESLRGLPRCFVTVPASQRAAQGQ